MPIDYEKYPKPERVRHHMSANVYFPFDERNPRPEYYPPVVEGNIDWAEHFDNGKGPDYLDIGCGMGMFLLDYADLKRDVNILGIEIRREPVNWIITVIKGEKLGNASALRYSVANGMDFIDSDSVSGIFYFFPDPWYKKRHHKRRAFTEEFLTECLRVLNKNGKLFIQTDVAELHEYHKEILAKWQENNISELIVEESFKSRDGQWDLPETDQEQVAIRADFEVHRLIINQK